MRLTVEQHETAMRWARQHFGDDVAIWLFGSRVDDEKKGGDYDFFVETSLDQADTIIAQKIAFIAALQSSQPFEDEKIDVVIKRRNASFDMPIYGVARTEGIRL